MASNLDVMASNLDITASNLDIMASNLNIIRQGNTARYMPPGAPVVANPSTTWGQRCRVVKALEADAEHPILDHFDQPPNSPPQDSPPQDSAPQSKSLREQILDLVDDDKWVSVTIARVGLEDRVGDPDDVGYVTVLIVVEPDSIVTERAVAIVSDVCGLLARYVCLPAAIKNGKC